MVSLLKKWLKVNDTTAGTDTCRHPAGLLNAHLYLNHQSLTQHATLVQMNLALQGVLSGV